MQGSITNRVLYLMLFDMRRTLVFYDGGCRMCVGLSGWIYHLDQKKQFELRPYQDSDLVKQFPELKPDQLEKHIHVIADDGRILRGADAMMEIWLKLRHFTSPLAYILKIPPFIWLARAVYNLIAMYRKDFYPNRN